MKSTHTLLAALLLGASSLSAQISENFNLGDVLSLNNNCWQTGTGLLNTHLSLGGSGKSINNGLEAPALQVEMKSTPTSFSSPYLRFGGSGTIDFKHRLTQDKGKFQMVQLLLIDENGAVVDSLFQHVYRDTKNNIRKIAENTRQESIPITWSGYYQLRWEWYGSSGIVYALMDDLTIDAYHAGDLLQAVAGNCPLSRLANEYNGAAWKLGAPMPVEDAVIAASGAPGSFEAVNLRIDPSATLTINAGETVSISGDLNNQGGSLAGDGKLKFKNDGTTLEITGDTLRFEGVVEITANTSLRSNGYLYLTASSSSSYGQLIGDGGLLDSLTVESHLDLNSGARYFHLGTPVLDAPISDFQEGGIMVAANSNQGTTWQWNATTATWEAPATLNNTAGLGRGYAIYAGTNQYGTFLRPNTGSIAVTGRTTNQDVIVPLNYNDGQNTVVTFEGGSSKAATEGWNFIANPYPSQYDWQGQSLPRGMANAVYSFNGVNYSSYVNGVPINSGSRYIAPFQGFWVQTTETAGSNFTFAASQRTTGGNAIRFKQKPDGLRLTVSDSSYSDELFIGFEHSATGHFDEQFDARKRLNAYGVPNIYTLLGEEAYSICRVKTGSYKRFPIHIKDDHIGQQMTLSANLVDLRDYSEAWIEDLWNGTKHNFKNGNYHFSHQQLSGNRARFILHLKGDNSMTEEELGLSDSWYAYSNGEQIVVELQDLEDVSVEVYNLAGQLLSSQQGANQSFRIDSPVARGVVIIRINHQGTIDSRKVVF